MPVFYVEFNLKKRSPVTVKYGDVIVDKGHPCVTVRNIEADSYDDAIQKARPRAEAFLDDLNFRSERVLETGTGLGVGLQDSPEFRHSDYHATLKAKGGHREKFPDTLDDVATKPSDAKALYRRAAISEHPFDKFRNLYLAIENVASKIQVVKELGKSEVKQFSESGQSYEKGLLKLAVDEYFGKDPRSLKQIAKDLPEFDDVRETNPQVAKILFEGYRVQLNHSKALENKKIPFNLEDERTVQRVLPLADFVAKSLLSYEDTYLLL
jgi:hypothetical protein